ncbi:hypothetical protein ONZ45_g2640 [Pleurotus djamor]|nr:hypothetical protein ONZ45_g2640 [Pleurotus djamor]
MPSSLSTNTANDDLAFIFLGTGTSSSLPHIECLTAAPEDTPCRTCTSTLTPEGKRNIRRNTSGVARVRGRDGNLVTIVIDVGKNFQAASLEWFPKHGLRKIDAVLITHAHADAMNGLDDLRGWTLNCHIQPHIDVYVSQATFGEVQRSFPYLVMKEFASGGGDVPEFKWHIITDKVPFEIQDTGIFITPFSVHHGRLFSSNPPPAYLPTPNATMPSTPSATSPSTPILPSKALPSPQSENGSIPKSPTATKIQPYLCFGFKIQDALVYLSDVSYVPDDVWPIIQGGKGNSPLPVCVLDCLRLQPHTSHLGLADSVLVAERIGACRTYLTGFGHEVSHEEYMTITGYVGATEAEKKKVMRSNLSEVEKQGISLVEGRQPIWVRPAHDGLKVTITNGGQTVDSSY